MKNLLNKLLFAYQVLMTSMVVFGIIRVSIGLIQGDFNNVSFYQY